MLEEVKIKHCAHISQTQGCSRVARIGLLHCVRSQAANYIGDLLQIHTYHLSRLVA